MRLSSGGYGANSVARRDKVEDHFVDVTDMIVTSEPLAVSRKPMASRALVYELYGLTEEAIRTIEGGKR